MHHAFPLYALHGFLGTPSDWKDVDVALDLYSNIIPFWDWAKAFNETVNKGFLVGYSMGGRLALHALVNNPEKWIGAVIISAQPGGLNPLRVHQDKQWAEKFLNDPWDSLMKEWNKQSIFQKDPPLVRYEANYSREKLSECLHIWSLGLQEDLRESISQLPMPILWVTGEHDLKYQEIAKSVHFSHPESQHYIAPDCGHRVPFQNEMIQNFVRKIYDSCDHNLVRS